MTATENSILSANSCNGSRASATEPIAARCLPGNGIAEGAWQERIAIVGAAMAVLAIQCMFRMTILMRVLNY
jgi:hypothetical protein